MEKKRVWYIHTMAYYSIMAKDEMVHYIKMIRTGGDYVKQSQPGRKRQRLADFTFVSSIRK